MRRLVGAVVALAAALAAAPAHAGDGSFTEVAGSPIPGPTADGGIVVGDFNRDGDQDIAVTGSGRQILTYVGGVGSTFSAGPTLNVTGSDVFDLAIGDFNEDGDQDLAVAAFGQNSGVEIFTGSAGVGFNAPATIALPSAVNLTVGDFNPRTDGDDDLAVNVSDFASSRVQILRGAAGAGFTTGSSTSLGNVLSGSIAVGQFDGRGWDDLAVLLPFQHQARILDGFDPDTFFATSLVNGGALVTGLAVGDFDLDGNEDLAIANRSSDNVSILAGDGPDGTAFAPKQLPATGLAPEDVAVGDFNSDGDEDLAVPASGDGALNVLLGGAGLAFGAPISTALGGKPGRVAVGDFDRDGNQDLAVVDLTGAGLHVLVGGGPPWSSGNLIEFGGAEALIGELVAPTPLPAAWSGTMGYLRYGSVGPTLAAAQRWEGGSNVIFGGVTNGATSLTQVADVSASAAGIDTGAALVRLSALLGGLRNEEDQMGVTATFINGAGVSIGSSSIAPVTRAARAGRTILLPRAATQPVPVGTRSIAVRLDATQPVPDSRNTAMADNVRLTLELPAPTTPTTPTVPAADATPPETTIDEGPQAKTEKQKAKITYSANEPATFECKLKGAARKLRKFSDCDAARIEYRNLDRGKKKFQVRAIDAAGNVDPTPAKLKWKVL